jgi:hypothetical protein
MEETPVIQVEGLGDSVLGSVNSSLKTSLVIGIEKGNVVGIERGNTDAC